MDTLFEAFARGEATRGKELMVFDWEKAAQLIKESGAMTASAGLEDDWGWTGGAILKDGQPLAKDQSYTYLASTWATPELDLGNGKFPCYRMQSATPGWDSDTFWPSEALAILGASSP